MAKTCQNVSEIRDDSTHECFLKLCTADMRHILDYIILQLSIHLYLKGFSY